MASWPQVRNRRETTGDEKHAYGYEFYHYSMGSLIFCVWGSFLILSTLSTLRTGNPTKVIGPCVIWVIRGACVFAEYTNSRNHLDRQVYRLYVQSFASDEHNPKGNSIKWPPQFKAWQVGLAMSAAIVLLAVGVRCPGQRWALWTGLAIPVEIVLRLAIEALWRKMELGIVAERWLMKKGWW